MLGTRDESGEEQGSGKHPTHECAEQYGQRDRRCTDDELQHLEPDDFVDEGGASRSDEEQQHRGEIARRCGHRRRTHTTGDCNASLRKRVDEGYLKEALQNEVERPSPSGRRWRGAPDEGLCRKFGSLTWRVSLRLSRHPLPCLLYTSDAADERSSVDLGGRRIIK